MARKDSFLPLRLPPPDPTQGDLTPLEKQLGLPPREKRPLAEIKTSVLERLEDFKRPADREELSPLLLETGTARSRRREQQESFARQVELAFIERERIAADAPGPFGHALGTVQRGVELAQHLFSPMAETIGPLALEAFTRGAPSVQPGAVVLEPIRRALGLGERDPESERLVVDFLLGKGDLSAVELGRQLEEHFGSRSSADQFVLSIFGDPTLAIPASAPLKLLRASIKGVFTVSRRTPAVIRAAGTEIRFSRFRNTGSFRTVINPPEAAGTIFNLPTIESGLSRSDQIKDVAKRLTLQVPLDPVATPAMKVLERSHQDISSIATAIAHKNDQTIRNVFKIDDSGLIQEFRGIHPDIKGAPGFSDLTENFSTYRAHMNPDQIKAMEALREEMRGLEAVARELEVPLLKFEDGNFYFPRGTVEDGIELVGGGGIGGRAGFEKPRIFASHAEGIAEGLERGFTYPTFRVALRSHVNDLGRRATDNHVGRYLREAIDPDTGLPISSTAAERVPAELRQIVESTRAKIFSRRQTIRGQDVRIGAASREAGRAVGGAETAVERTARAAKRVDDRAGGFSESAIKDARADLTEAIADTKDFAYRLGENKINLQQARKVLNARERDLFRALDDLEEAVTEADRFLQTAAAKGSILDVRAAVRQSDILTTKVARMAEDAEKAAAKVDSLIETRQLVRDLGTGVRSEMLAARRLVRNLMDQRRTIGSLEREWRALKREQTRLTRAADKANARLSTAEGRKAVTVEGLRDLEDAMAEVRPAWERWKRMGTPRGTGSIDLPTVQGHSFPAEVANAANIVLKERHPLGGRVVDVYNNFYRGMRATGDLSAPGIQGLLAMPNAPGATLDALKVMFYSIGTDKSLGAFINQFDNIATASRRPLSTDWARRGLRLGGADTEMALGRGVDSKLASLPLIQQANRAFGYYGDALRLQWADDILAGELRLSRAGFPGTGASPSMAEIIDAGDLERIADFVNNATGWSRNRSFGRVGDLLLFAPRFLNSRLTTLTKGLAGLRPGAPIDQRLAFRSFTRMIGSGVVLTIGVNEMLGNETDFRPFLDDNFKPTFVPSSRKNSNFIRIRWGDRDWSVFGTWDSLLGLIIGTAGGFSEMALAAFTDAEAKAGVKSIASSVRGMGSGGTQLVAEIVTGRTFMGEEVPNPWEDPADYALYLLKSHIPFATEEAGEVGQQIAGGIKDSDVGQVVTGVVAGVGEVFGIKSTPVTANEHRDTARKQAMVELDLPGIYADLDAAPRDKVDKAAGVLSATQEVETQRRRKSDPYQVEYKDVAAKLKLERDTSIKTFFDQNRYGSALRDHIDTEQTIYSSSMKQLRADRGDLLEFFKDLDPRTGALDQAINAYRERLNDKDNPWIDPITRVPDFDKREEILKGLRDEFGEARIEEVVVFIHREDPKVVIELRQAREFLRRYWNITEDQIAEWDRDLTPGLAAEYKAYLDLEEPRDHAAFLIVHPELTAALNAIERIKHKFREVGGEGFEVNGVPSKNNNPRFDEELFRWGYVPTPIHPEVVKKNEDRQIRMLKEGEFDVGAER